MKLLDTRTYVFPTVAIAEAFVSWWRDRALLDQRGKYVTISARLGVFEEMQRREDDAGRT